MYAEPRHVQEKDGAPPIHGGWAAVTHQDSDTRNAQQPKIMTNGLMFMGSMETLVISVCLELKP